MLERKDFKLIFIISITLFSIIMCCFCFLATGKAVIFINGFAVDSKDRLYVGLSNKICIYENGNLIKEFDHPEMDSYTFTITETDSIILVSPPLIYNMDLDGNIESIVDDYARASLAQRNIENRSKPYVSFKGDTYREKGLLGQLRIEKNGYETVYQVSFLSVIVKYALILVFIGLWVFVVYFLATRLPVYFKKKGRKT